MNPRPVRCRVCGAYFFFPTLRACPKCGERSFRYIRRGERGVPFPFDPDNRSVPHATLHAEPECQPA